MKISVYILGAALAASVCRGEVPPPLNTPRALVLAVSDPLALELACPCINGFAQRNYQMLAEFLTRELPAGYQVEVVFAASIREALRESKGAATLFIGKQSELLHDAQEPGISIHPVSALTDRQGATTLTGLFVVRTESPASSLKDLAGYQLHCGMPFMEEKYAAALAALRDNGVPLQPARTHLNCSAAVWALLDEEAPAVAVISDYALSLLEGCGAIEPGALKVIGKTAAVPFVYLFASDALSRTDERLLRAALKRVKDNPRLCQTMESLKGFVELPEHSAPWPGWRGAERDGIVERLPDQLPLKSVPVWTAALTYPSGSPAGVACSGDRVVVADRDDAAARDIFICFDAATGARLWQYSYQSAGDLDYGNAPRATPLIDSGFVYTLGAMGVLSKIALADGALQWQLDYRQKFGAALTEWGHCASPLLVSGRLIVQPGAENASVVALNPLDGSVLWQSSGARSAYSSPVAGVFGGKAQIIGYDALALGGWDIESGRRLWSLQPPVEGDFNVPTPVPLPDGRLLVMSENNGTRIHSFHPDGTIRPEPDAENAELAGNSMTPVVIDGKVCGVHNGLRILAAADLRELAVVDDDTSGAFHNYASIVADRRGALLVTSLAGQLLLYDLSAGTPRCISRLQILPPDEETLSHPAVVGNRLYLCGPQKLYCIQLW